MAEEKTYTLAEARKVLEEREKQDKMHRTIHDLRQQVDHLKGMNKSIKRAHKKRVTQTHKQERHIAKLYDVLDRVEVAFPGQLRGLKEVVKETRQARKRDKEDSFRHARRERRARAAQAKSIRLAHEAGERQKEAERQRLALEAKKAEENRQPVAARG